MKSPYEKLNYFYLHHIPFLPLATRGNAVNCRIGLSRQLVFIPKKYFNVGVDDITLKEGMDLEWFFRKRDTQNKIKHFLDEIGGVKDES